MSEIIGMLQYRGELFPLNDDKSKVRLSVAQESQRRCDAKLHVEFYVESDVAAQTPTSPKRGELLFKLDSPISWSNPVGMKFEQETWNDPPSFIYSGIFESSTYDCIEFESEHDGRVFAKIEMKLEEKETVRVAGLFKFTCANA